MFTLGLYVLSALLLFVSFICDKQKSKMALKKAWGAFENILPQFLAIIVIVGMMLAIVSPGLIVKLIGRESGWLGTVSAAVIGSITLIPGFVAFPLAAALLNSGAGLMQIAAFISTLMMVGIVTLPLEISYFGKKAAVVRNTLAFIFSFLAAMVIGEVLK